MIRLAAIIACLLALWCLVCTMGFWAARYHFGWFQDEIERCSGAVPYDLRHETKGDEK